ncbi:DMT family transporter [Streptomyces sp. SP17BM10]|uniref:DMT family transporter n=1 Tax=Streptomyces sp. SP17BM10 TaxID=3002530 RepID=UPI002E7745DC|nr:DMT family transporter [Streptomyces sp. SP17BM10]MEE1786213.1 DMT family transporter [Streptomyces sp. SP17BM10]
MSGKNKSLKVSLIALVFVTIYGSGFVGGRFGLPYAEPFAYLAIRFGGTAVVLFALVVCLRIPWPRTRSAYVHLVLSGILLQGVFSTGVFYALYYGMTPAVSALIIALQPILVWLMVSVATARKVRPLSVLALAGGLAGVALTVYQGLASSSGLTLTNVAFDFLGLIGLSTGQFYYQMKNPGTHPLINGFLQSGSSAVVMLAGALVFETGVVHWTRDLVLSELWMSVGVSIGALSLLFVLMRSESADRVASYFYGVPIAAGLIAWPMLDQRPTLSEVIGFAVIVASIVLFNRSSRAPAPTTAPAAPVGAEARTADRS